MSTGKKTKSEDYYCDFEKLRDEYFEKIKAEYLHAVEIAVKKTGGHNAFQNRKMKDESMRLQKELGVFADLMNTIRNEMELDKRLTEREMFNQKVKELAADKREAMVKPLAEYEGLRLMYGFWQNREPYIRIIDEQFNKPVEALTYVEKDFAESFVAINQIREKEFSLTLKNRLELEDKISFTKVTVTNVQANIENDLLYKLYTLCNQNLKGFGAIFFYNLGTLSHVPTMIFGEKEEQITEATKILLEHTFETQHKENRNDVNSLIKSLKERGINSNALTNALRGQFKKEEHRLLYVMFYFYYEIQYLNFLSKTLKELEQPKPDMTENDIAEEIQNSEFTNHRAVLAFYYLFEFLKIQNDEVKVAAKARFIQFISGREEKNKNIKNTKIYKSISRPFSKKTRQQLSDLQFVREKFEMLGLSSIVDMITNDINK